MELNKQVCNHKIGTRIIEYGSISHPGGPQCCFECNKTLKDILEEARAEGYMRCYDKVESIIAEFGDTPSECLSIIGQMNDPEPVEY